MGIYLGYDKMKGKWCWKGYGFRKYYDTKEQAEADKANVWELHNRNLTVNNIIVNMLASYR